MKKFNLATLKGDYKYPDTMKNTDGSSKYAYVTFLMRNDNYLPGALLFAYGLRKKGTGADLICMVSKTITAEARYALGMLFDYVIEIDEVYVPNKRGHSRQDIPYVFTRFNALRLGKDGDLGHNYEKIVLADADLMPVRFFDHLFTLDTPAGIINEHKENFLEHDSKGGYRIDEDIISSGKWVWHRIYNEICPHGHHIPGYLTEKVRYYPENLGVNSSVFVLKPSYDTFLRIFEALKEPEIKKLVASEFRWPEMQFATLFWSGKWTNIDVRFSGINGYPDISLLCGIHYAGTKPWNVRDTSALRRVAKFPDYRLWYKKFMEMSVIDCKNLLKIGRISKLMIFLEKNKELLV